MKKYILYLCFAGISLLCCSCGAKEKAPKLQDEVTRSEQKYTVERQSIGNTVSGKGSVIGELSLLHFEKDGTIKDIYVHPGDKVKKGQVLATLDDTELQEQLQAVRSNMEKAARDLQDNLEIQDYQIKKKEFHIGQLKKEKGGEKQIHLDEIAIEELQYEKKYMQDVYGITKEENEKEEKRLTDEIAKGIIKAPADGTVVHVQGLFEENGKKADGGMEISADEALLYFTNPDKKYVSTGWLITDEGVRPEDITSIKGCRGNVRAEMKRADFSSEVQNYFQKKQWGLNTLFEIVDDTDWEEGDVVMFIMECRHKDNVLAVPNNAVHRDKEGEYVYCLYGEEKKRVSVETGIKTETCTEITKGVKEGDVVSYTEYITPLETVASSENQEMQEAKAEISDVATEDEEDTEMINTAYQDVYQQNYGGERGEFVRYAVKDGKKVKKGDVIAYVKEDVKNSELYQAEAEVNQKADDMAKAYQEYLKGQQELDKQIGKSDNRYEKKSLQMDKYIAAKEYQISYRADLEEKRALSAQYDTLLQKKEGAPVVAGASGVLERSSLKKGDILEKGKEIASITNEDFLYISLGGYGWTGNGMRIQYEGKKEDRANIWGLTAFAEYESSVYTLVDGKKYKRGDTPEKIVYDAFSVQDVLTLPQAAVMRKWIQQGQNGYLMEYVFVKKGDELERRQIATGIVADDKCWVMSGLEEGETVVYVPEEEEEVIEE